MGGDVLGNDRPKILVGYGETFEFSQEIPDHWLGRPVIFGHDARVLIQLLAYASHLSPDEKIDSKAQKDQGHQGAGKQGAQRVNLSLQRIHCGVGTVQSPVRQEIWLIF